MEINISNLVSIEKALNEPLELFKAVDDIGKIVILKDNKPAYILLRYDENTKVPVEALKTKFMLTLQEAMKIVLSENEERTLHASKLADIIYERKLYVQKNGEKAKYNQIRARCGHYPDMFETLPGNNIKLREEVK